MQTRLVSVSYDAARGAFEGRVDVERNGRVFRYPALVQAPESAARDWVEQAMTRQALGMSDTPPAAAPARSLLRDLFDAVARATAPRPALRDLPVPADEHRRLRTRLH